jgi:hypothetical protein
LEYSEIAPKAPSSRMSGDTRTPRKLREISSGRPTKSSSGDALHIERELAITHR